MDNLAPTRIGYNSESAIDITLCTATLTPIIDWTVSASPGDSDYCPIYVTIMRQYTLIDDSQIDKWNFRKADWTSYTNDETMNNFLDVTTVENKFLIVDLYNRIYQAAQNSIPIYRSIKYIPKPGGQIH